MKGSWQGELCRGTLPTAQTSQLWQFMKPLDGPHLLICGTDKHNDKVHWGLCKDEMR